jgi:hypothetical protein
VLDTEKQLRKRDGIPPAVVILAAAVLIGGTLAGFLWWQGKNRTGSGPVLTEEAREYLTSLDLSGVEMSAEESFLGHTVVVIAGNIANLGGRTVRNVEINCVFRDLYQQEIARQRMTIVGRSSGPLAPGGEQPFRLAFDTVPEGWNQAMPSLFIAQIVFEP